MSAVLSITLPEQFGMTASCSDSVLRLILYNREVYRLRRSDKQIQVLSGIAWVTISGEDLVLTQGEQISFRPQRHIPAIVSPLGRDPLVIEVGTGEVA